MTISSACVDAGFLQPVVQNFCNQRNHRRIFPTKGAPGPGRPVWPRTASESKDKRPLWIVGVDAAKEAITTRLKIAEAGPGYCHFPTGDMYDAAYFSQLTAETCKIKYLKGFAHREWSKKIGARNEALDCRVYAYAALQSLCMAGFRLSQQADLIEAMYPGRAAQCQEQAVPAPAAPTTREPWIKAGPGWLRGSGR
jgi:phage terminase large subunit GpA-like protein